MASQAVVVHRESSKQAESAPDSLLRTQPKAQSSLLSSPFASPHATGRSRNFQQNSFAGLPSFAPGFSQFTAVSKTPGLPLGGCIQKKLSIGSSSDPLEAEADAMAERVVGTNSSSHGAAPVKAHSAIAQVQRKCNCANSEAKCSACKEEEEHDRVHRKAIGEASASTAPPIVHNVLSRSGQPLDAATRAYMEPRFGYDFSRVRVHADSESAQSASAIQAQAYTVNHSIAFGAGSYAPHTAAGRRLLAHELSHVVQQGEASPLSGGNLKIGSVHDAAEADADRTAESVISGHAIGSGPRLSSAQVIRRTPDTKGDSATLTTGPGETVNVTRTLRHCPCSRVADTRTGVFYNPDLQSLAIAYKKCHGSTHFETFLRTATDFSGGGAPTGDARIGVDVTIWGKNVQGRILVEGVGQNQSGGPGVGGHAKFMLQGGKWVLQLEPTFIHELGRLAADTNANQLEINLGAKYKDFKVDIDAKNILSGNRLWEGGICKGAFCIGVDVQERPGQRPDIQPRIGIKIDLDPVKEEKCYQCLCPAPVKKFQCIKHTHKDAVPPQKIDQERTPEYRYYFAWDKVTPSEDSYLRDASQSNLSQMKTELAKPGYTIASIIGYASPEGKERQINIPLAKARGEKMAKIVKDEVGSTATVPKPTIGSAELLGHNPAEPGVHLRDALKASNLKSAEAVTPILTGSEIMPPQMTPEFLDLFKRTNSDEWMQLFGLDGASPIRPNVEDAVKAFIASEGKGPRPWERVFRLLRFGAVTLHGTEKIDDPNDKGKPAEDHNPDVDEDACKGYGKQAESTGALPAIDPALMKPSATDAESDESCFDPAPDDTKAGCDYTLPANLNNRYTPTAPDYAPKNYTPKTLNMRDPG